MTNNSSFINKIVAFYRRCPVWSNLILIAISAAILLWICLLFLDLWTHHGDNATVPEIKHLSYTEARDTLAKSGLSIEIADSIYDTSIAPGTIIESWPKAGAVVKAGRNIYVTITAFSPKEITITRPITGVSARQAISYLNALGFNNIRMVNVPSEYPDLVQSAHSDNRPIGVGSMLPVSATITLEVGVAINPTPTDSISAEDAIEQELSSASEYND